MADRISIQHTTFALMGPLVRTTTRAMSCHCVIFQIGERVILLDTGFGTRATGDSGMCPVCNYRFIQRNDEGAEDYYFKSSIDVTNRKRARRPLAISKRNSEQTVKVLEGLVHRVEI
jgi:hypothetical protein